MNSGKKIRLFTYISLAAGSMWFSCSVGPGFASGTQEVQYYVKFGVYGLLFPILAIGLEAVLFYIMLETVRFRKCSNYGEMAREMFQPYGKLSLGIEVTQVVTTITSCAATVASASTILNSTFGWNYTLCSFAVGILVILICMYGTKVVRACSAAMSVAIIVVLAIIIVFGIVSHGDKAVAIASNPSFYAESEWYNGSFEMWEKAFLYAGFQAGAVAIGALGSEGLEHRKQSAGASILGFAIVTGFTVLVNFMLMGFVPDVVTGDGSALPIMYAAQNSGFTAIKVLYPFFLLLALLTTASTLCWSISGRVNNTSVMKKVKSPAVRNTIVTVVMLAISVALAQFGVVAIVNKGFSLFGLLNLIFVFLPTFTLGAINLKKWRKAEKLAESQCEKLPTD